MSTLQFKQRASDFTAGVMVVLLVLVISGIGLYFYETIQVQARTPPAPAATLRADMNEHTVAQMQQGGVYLIIAGNELTCVVDGVAHPFVDPRP